MKLAPAEWWVEDGQKLTKIRRGVTLEVRGWPSSPGCRLGLLQQGSEQGSGCLLCRGPAVRALHALPL